MLALKQPLYSLERSLFSLRPRMLKFPDFISIGSGQAGSTWMFRNLECHPDVFVARKKEVHYFSRNFHRVSLHNYSAQFSEAGQRICGELTPAYLLLPPERIAYMHRLMPDLRLIMTIRNPVDRAWSGARRTMAKLAETENIPVEEFSDDEYFAYFDKEWAYRPERNPPGDYVKGMLQGHYCRAIDHYKRYFADDQLLICFFDDIKREPRLLLERIFQHIGARTDVDWSSFLLGKVINQNPTRDIPERFLHYLEKLYEPEIAELQQRFPEKTAHWTQAD